MQIIMSDDCPIQSAINLDDKLLCQSITQSVMILSSIMHKYGYRCSFNGPKVEGPLVEWGARNVYNYIWLYHHFCGLLDEYEKRCGELHIYDKYVIPLHMAIVWMPDYFTGNRDPFPYDVSACREFLKLCWQADSTVSYYREKLACDQMCDKVFKGGSI